MDKQVIFDYIKQNGEITVPELQLKFNLSYCEARSIVDELVESFSLIFDKDVRYVYVPVGHDCEETDNIELAEHARSVGGEMFVRQRYSVLSRIRQARIFGQSDDNDYDEYDYDDEADTPTDENGGEPDINNETADIGLAIGSFSYDKEIREWLELKLSADENFSLQDAQKQSREELLHVKKCYPLISVPVCHHICEFFSNCSESEYETLKKSITQ